MIETSGAPRGQGLDQGSVFGPEIRDYVRELRGSRDWLAWRRSLALVHRTTGRELARFAPQLHERLQGMATAARTPVAALELCEERCRFALVAKHADGALRCTVPPSGLTWQVRRSVPDAGGFASVELTAAPLASAVCGVNAEGIAVACLADARPHTQSARVLVQDVLFRTRSFASALEHVRRRAAYLRACGTLFVCSADGDSARLLLDRGDLTVSELPNANEAAPGRAEANACEVRIDLGSRSLEWNGERHVAGG